MSKEDDVEDLIREVFKRLARQVEYAVDNNMEIRNLTKEDREKIEQLNSIEGTNEGVKK